MKTVILLVLVAVAFASDCNNPLLQRSDIQARFGGAINILNQPVTAGPLNTCSYLSNQQVCVNNNGYTFFDNWFGQYKQALQQRGTALKRAQIGTVGLTAGSVNADTCYTTYSNFARFIALGLYQQQTNSSSSNGNIFFGPLWTTNLVVATSTVFANPSQQSAIANAKSFIQSWQGRETTYVQEKAVCMQQAVKHVVSVTCTASNANYQTSVVGTPGAPQVYIRTSTCSNIQTLCMNYYTDAKGLNLAATALTYCTNPNATQVSALMGQIFTAAVNTQLNTYWNSFSATLLAQVNTQAATTPQFKGLMCDSSTTTASDCNFFCLWCINATGFKEISFDNLDMTSNVRVLQDASIILTSGNNGLTSDVTISDSIAVMQPDFLSIRGENLVVSFLALIIGYLLI